MKTLKLYIKTISILINNLILIILFIFRVTYRVKLYTLQKNNNKKNVIIKSY